MKIKAYSLLGVAFIALLGCKIPESSLDYVSPYIGTLKHIPGGSFQRDFISTNISTVSSFRISTNEITRDQFLAIMGVDPVVAYLETDKSSGMDDPVMMVNWFEAITFCNKLSIAEGLTPVYSISGIDFDTITYESIPKTWNATWDSPTVTWENNGYRLPTEMEWMWAAMGAPVDGQSGVNRTGYLLPFSGSTGSNDIKNFVWYNENSDGMTHPKSTKTANRLGLYDMSGNVSEWCWDLIDVYPEGTLINYRGAYTSSTRSIRGGDWFEDSEHCKIENRYNSIAADKGYFLGFRVVLP